MIRKLINTGIRKFLPQRRKVAKFKFKKKPFKLLSLQNSELCGLRVFAGDTLKFGCGFVAFGSFVTFAVKFLLLL